MENTSENHEMFYIAQKRPCSAETVALHTFRNLPCFPRRYSDICARNEVYCSKKKVTFLDTELEPGVLCPSPIKTLSVVDVSPKEMATRAVFLYPDLDKSAVRALRVEERVLELKVLNLDINKKSVALDLKKSQNEMKKRLRKYRDRQRDIFRVKSSVQSPNQSLDEFLASNMKNKTFTRNSLRPSTCPAKITRIRPATSHAAESIVDKEIEIDPSFFTDQRKSKIDLRPSTAREFNGDKNAIRKCSRLGRLGEPEVQIRYFDEDELQDRGTFYTQLVEWRKRQEEDRAKSLDYKVGVFCEQDENEINRRLKRNCCLRQSTRSAMDFSRKKEITIQLNRPVSSRPNSSEDEKKENISESKES